jgi:hypothetical protein
MLLCPRLLGCNFAGNEASQLLIARGGAVMCTRMLTQRCDGGNNKIKRQNKFSRQTFEIWSSTQGKSYRRRLLSQYQHSPVRCRHEVLAAGERAQRIEVARLRRLYGPSPGHAEGPGCGPAAATRLRERALRLGLCAQYGRY